MNGTPSLSISDLVLFWNTLKCMHHLRLEAQTQDATREGLAVVEISSSPSTLWFHETGQWLDSGIVFRNQLRWTLFDSQVALEHLRYGTPIFLAYFVPVRKGQMESICPHICSQDEYRGAIAWNEQEIALSWTIRGPRKDDRLVCRYTARDSRIGF